jgi:hypothetical protein
MKKSTKNRAIALLQKEKTLEHRIKIYLAVTAIYIYFITAIFL